MKPLLSATERSVTTEKCHQFSVIHLCKQGTQSRDLIKKYFRELTQYIGDSMLSLLHKQHTLA